MRYEPDAIVAMADGKITHFGPASQVRAQLPDGTVVKEYGRDTVIMAGFIDCHVHYPQTQIIGAFGEQLIDWLDKYTFIAEQQFADAEHAREVARVFLQECLRAGTTSAAVYCTVHPQSVDAFFEESARLGTRMIAGKVLMDRNAPAALHGHCTAGLRRIQGTHRQVAWQRPATLRRDAPIRGEQHARADGNGRRAVAGASRHVSAVTRVRESA